MALSVMIHVVDLSKLDLRARAANIVCAHSGGLS
jgi:hypothetical protein